VIYSYTVRSLSYRCCSSLEQIYRQDGMRRNTALHEASAYGYFKVCQILLAAGGKSALHNQVHTSTPPVGRCRSCEFLQLSLVRL